jgi:RimJ/RimL family protein N-acetyltransferase
MSYNFWEGEKIRLRAQEPREDYMNYDTEADRMGDIIHFPPARTAEPSNDEFNFIIENKNGNVVGGISTHCVNRRMGTFKYGISIKREYWGMGYATEAICIVLRIILMNYVIKRLMLMFILLIKGQSDCIKKWVSNKREF